jgi:phage gp46-like protein
MAQDFEMSVGDNILEDGNYRTTDTAAGMMYRCLMSAYGKWPGGRGEAFGNQLWNRERMKGSQADIDQVIADCTDAVQPLVDLGVISDVTVVQDTDQYGRLAFLITAFDNSRQGTVEVPVSAPWGS